MVKLFNLMEIPVLGLHLNATRCLLALTDRGLGTSAVMDNRALSVLISSLDTFDEEALENTLWIIANAAKTGMYPLFSLPSYSFSLLLFQNLSSVVHLQISMSFQRFSKY